MLHKFHASVEYEIEGQVNEDGTYDELDVILNGRVLQRTVIFCEPAEDEDTEVLW